MFHALLSAIAAVAVLADANLDKDDNYLRPVHAEESDLPDTLNHAVFAAGCFWCSEADFEKLPGVIAVISGYTGGDEANPTYQNVLTNRTGHVEAVRVIYDRERINYEQLLAHFWVNVDPFDNEGQFCDRGASYAPVIFLTEPTQMQQVEASLAVLTARFEAPILVKVDRLKTFWPAETYHQDYAKNNPMRYTRYRFGCQRDQRLKRVWGSDAMTGEP